MEEMFIWTILVVLLLTGVIVAYKLWMRHLDGKDIDLGDVIDVVKDVHEKHGEDIKELSEDLAKKDFGGAKDHLIEQKDEIMDEAEDVIDKLSKGDGDG